MLLGQASEASDHTFAANGRNRKSKAGLPEPLPKDQVSMPLGGLISDETFTPCEGDQCEKQIGYDKVEFDKKAGLLLGGVTDARRFEMLRGWLPIARVLVHLQVAATSTWL